MKRWVLRIYLSLLLGAVVNVALAWVCANYSNDFGVTYLHFPSRMFMTDGSPNPGYMPDRFESAGWPVRSTTSKSFAVEPLWGGIAINTVFYSAILWVGWLIFAAPFALRRRIRERRIKRGLCPT